MRGWMLAGLGLALGWATGALAGPTLDAARARGGAGATQSNSAINRLSSYRPSRKIARRQTPSVAKPNRS